MRTHVVGYVRTPRPDRNALDTDIEQLSGHAEANDLMIVEVYREDGVPCWQRERPAFTAMIAALEQGKATGALIPSAVHLSADPEIRASLVARIQRTGATLYVMQAEPDD